MFDKKKLISLMCFLFLLAIVRGQDYVTYLKRNRSDTQKIRSYLLRNKLLKEEYANLLICSCINEYQKKKISLSADSCYKDENDIGQLKFSEYFHTSTLTRFDIPLFYKNIDDFTKEVLELDIKREMKKEEYNVISVAIFAHCKKLVESNREKYLQILLRNPVTKLLPWLYN